MTLLEARQIVSRCAFKDWTLTLKPEGAIWLLQARFKDGVHEWTTRHWLFLSAEEQIGRINRLLAGWANYFSVGTRYSAYGKIDQYVFRRLRRWWAAKHKERNWRTSRFTGLYASRKLGQRFGAVLLRCANHP